MLFDNVWFVFYPFVYYKCPVHRQGWDLRLSPLDDRSLHPTPMKQRLENWSPEVCLCPMPGASEKMWLKKLELNHQTDYI